MESPEVNPHIYGQMIFDRGARTIQWGKESFQQMVLGKNWISICKRMKLDFYLMPYTKINSKWLKHLNIRPDTIKLLEASIGKHSLT